MTLLAAGRAGGGHSEPVAAWSRPKWRITAEALAAVASARTKLVISIRRSIDATIASDRNWSARRILRRA